MHFLSGLMNRLKPSHVPPGLNPIANAITSSLQKAQGAPGVPDLLRPPAQPAAPVDPRAAAGQSAYQPATQAIAQMAEQAAGGLKPPVPTEASPSTPPAPAAPAGPPEMAGPSSPEGQPGPQGSMAPPTGQMPVASPNGMSALEQAIMQSSGGGINPRAMQQAPAMKFGGGSPTPLGGQ
jgi:hypothetical protein